MEEGVFVEILGVVEAFGRASPSLPPHGNLSADAVWQLLTTRDGASEASKQSRWVVGDWLLTYDPDNVGFDAASVVGDLEFMLYSAFLQLNIVSEDNGAFLSRSRVEQRIDETVERIRCALFSVSPNKLVPSLDEGSVCPKTGSGAMVEMDTVNISVSASSGFGLGMQPSDTIEDSPLISVEEPSLERKILNHFPNSSSIGSAQDAMNFARGLPLRDRINFHQNELRQEQQLANRYRRRTAMLPPLPRSNSCYSSLFEEYKLGVDEPYEIQPQSPIAKLTPSLLLTDLSTASVPDQPCPDSSRTKGRGKKRNGRTTKPTGNLVEATRSALKPIPKADTNQWKKDREALLQDVISTMLLLQQLRLHPAKKKEDKKPHHDVLRDGRVMNAGIDKGYSSFFRNDHPLVCSDSTGSPKTDLQSHATSSETPFQRTSAFYARRDMDKIMSRKAMETATTETAKNRRRLLNYADPTSMHRGGRGRRIPSRASPEAPVIVQSSDALSTSSSRQVPTTQDRETPRTHAGVADLGMTSSPRWHAPSRGGAGLSNGGHGGHCKAPSKSTSGMVPSQTSSLKVPEPSNVSLVELASKTRPVVQQLPLAEVVEREEVRRGHLSTFQSIPPQHITRASVTAREVGGALWGISRPTTSQSARPPAFPSFANFGNGSPRTPRGYRRTLTSRSYVDFAYDIFMGDKGGGLSQARDGHSQLSTRGRPYPSNTAAAWIENIPVSARFLPHSGPLHGAGFNEGGSSKRRLNTLDGSQSFEAKLMQQGMKRSLSSLGFTVSSQRIKSPTTEGRRGSVPKTRGMHNPNTEFVANPENRDAVVDANVPGEKLQLYSTPKKLLLSQVRLPHGVCIKIIRTRRGTDDTSEG
ncbi:unnamed protein product [Phytomonas sp. EM1]|nr:unnamed protein product [Phytomonas sp. EM1]|eukprot:CCW61593.1 unnamed protein product [Phytomonas sp. isolate EM1]